MRYKKKIFYWAPCLNPVGTVKSVINSANALAKYEKNFEVCIINSCGEWNQYYDKIDFDFVKIINLNFFYFKWLPKYGFFKSRFSYIIIFLLSFIPLLKLLKKEKPDIIINHLISSLPLLLLNLFKFDTSFVLRISGMPKLNLIRKIFWKLTAKKLYYITCPSIQLKEKINELKIFSSKKIYYLPDAVIDIKDFKKQLETKNFHDYLFKKNKKVFLAAGRHTKQKNFLYLIKEFSKFSQENKDTILIILGDGEETLKLSKKIKKLKMENNIFLIGRVQNVMNYMKNADAFILSSLWEEMGFVIIEAALTNLYIISSDCPNGPSEFLNYGENGILFENNKKNSLYNNLNRFKSISEKKIKLDKFLIKKNCLKFTKFRHQKILKEIL